MKKKHLILIVGFLAYLAALVRIVLFKGLFFFRIVPTSSYYKRHHSNSTYSGYNLVPFRTIKLFLSDSASASAAFFNLAGNILLFVPFGLLLPLIIRSTATFSRTVLATILLSVFFEVYQYIARIGKADIDDIILNTVGGATGYALYLMVRRVVRSGPLNY
ncbi:MAG TPA: VanZ family protein [Flavisolibacter sp.]|jgi:glycopeptide antibiotics resistance protein|nr:VanZ family protein [Flavisolibacter sp.]